MYKLFSRKLGYLAILLELQLCLISISVYCSDLEGNYYNGRNSDLCSRDNNCQTQTSSPAYFGDSHLNIGSVNITVHNTAPQRSKVKQWTFVNGPAKQNSPSPVYKPKKQNIKHDIQNSAIRQLTVQEQQAYYNKILNQYRHSNTNTHSSNSKSNNPATRKQDNGNFGYSHEDYQTFPTNVQENYANPPANQQQSNANFASMQQDLKADFANIQQDFNANFPNIQNDGNYPNYQQDYGNYANNQQDYGNYPNNQQDYGNYPTVQQDQGKHATTQEGHGHVAIPVNHGNAVKIHDDFVDFANTQQNHGNLANIHQDHGKHVNIQPVHGDLANIQTDDGGFDVTLSPGGFKVAVIMVAIGYIIIGLLAKTNIFFSGQQSLSPCYGPRAEEFPISIIHAENARPRFQPYEDSELQQSLFDMFSPYGGPSVDLGGMPDLSGIASMCSRNAFFYGMNHQHMQAVEMITDMLLNEPDVHGMMSMAKALRRSPAINPKVWYTAMMKASHERPDMQGMIMPGPFDAMPDTFIPGNQIGRTLSSIRSRKSGRSHHKHHEPECIRVDGIVGRDNGVENLLWYFREDIMVNSHHWYWHLSYPLISKSPRDRRGELFYFSHGSMVARYNIERLSHGLDFAVPLDVFPHAPIHEGYNTHLTDLNSGMPWTDRPPYTLFTDIIHFENPNSRAALLLKPWLRSRDRILKSIRTGIYLGKRRKMGLPSYEGINMIANTLEANEESINPRYYTPDGYHNTGHRIIGYLVDPLYELRLPPGPMGDPATAMRDPVFYRWHTNIHNIFSSYKSTLTPYEPIGGEFPLFWNGVEVKEISVVSRKGSTNDLKTFWNHKKFDLSLGLAFNRTADSEDDFEDHLKVCATHLDHEEFEYNIHVNRKPCVRSKSNTATVRVFIAPRYDLHGKRFSIKQQRRLFVHLDVFNTQLNVGRNIITRHSTESTLTIPFTQSLRQLQSNFGNRQAPNCGCGWPHHLLLPKGTSDGMKFDLFVMITNGDYDLVKDGPSNPFEEKCASNFLFCGIQNRRYPDAKPMGYPFDRDIYRISSLCSKWGHSIWSKLCSLFAQDWRVPKYLEDYTRGITNMGFSQILITHDPR